MKTLDSIISGIKAIAPTVAGFVVPGSGPLVHDLLRAVSGIGSETPIEEVAAKVVADPALMVQLQGMAMQHEVSLGQIEVQKMALVNATMQAEANSTHWPQWSWRPYNGFAFGTAIILIYFCLPIFGRPVPLVPEWIWVGWASILGVATWDRGKMQRIQAGDNSEGIIARTIKAIKG